jgi:uncharacterized membrane protein
VSPPKLPKHLHWFFWESYSTWLSGFALFTVSYLYSASTYLIDKSRMDWAPATAIAVALAFFVVFWLLYDAICRIFGQKKEWRRHRGRAGLRAGVHGLVAGLPLVCGARGLFAGGRHDRHGHERQRVLLDHPRPAHGGGAIKAGQPVDPIHGKRGKQRSVHNTYFTLPVLFAMLSNHYSFTWSHPQNWLVLILMMFAGAAIRQFFVMRHGYKLGRNGNPLPYALVGVAVMVAMVWLRPAPPTVQSVGATDFSSW